MELRISLITQIPLLKCKHNNIIAFQTNSKQRKYLNLLKFVVALVPSINEKICKIFWSFKNLTYD